MILWRCANDVSCRRIPPTCCSHAHEDWQGSPPCEAVWPWPVVYVDMASDEAAAHAMQGSKFMLQTVQRFRTSLSPEAIERFEAEVQPSLDLVNVPEVLAKGEPFVKKHLIEVMQQADKDAGRRVVPTFKTFKVRVACLLLASLVPRYRSSLHINARLSARQCAWISAQTSKALPWHSDASSGAALRPAHGTR